MAEALMAISLVAKSIAFEIMKNCKGGKDVENKATNGSKGRCRESCI